MRLENRKKSEFGFAQYESTLILMFIILCDMVQVLSTFTRVKAYSHQAKAKAQAKKDQGTGKIDQLKNDQKTQKKTSLSLPLSLSVTGPL